MHFSKNPFVKMFLGAFLGVVLGIIFGLLFSLLIAFISDQFSGAFMSEPGYSFVVFLGMGAGAMIGAILGGLTAVKK